LLICITIFGFVPFAFAQTADQVANEYEKMGDLLDRKGQYEDSKDYWAKASEIRLNQKNWDQYFIDRAYYANAHSKLSQIKLVDQEMRKIRRELDSLKVTYPAFVFDTIELIIRRFDLIIKLEQNDLKGAETICSSIIKEFEGIEHKSDYDKQILITQYFRKGEILIQKRSFESALTYNGKAINAINTGGYQDAYTEDGAILNAFLQNADCHLALNDDQSLLIEFDRLREHLEHLGTKVDERSFSVYQRIFNYYLDQEKKDSAEHYLNLMNQISSFQNEVIYYQSKFYGQFDAPEVAIPALIQAAQKIKQTSGSQHASYIDLLLDIAKIYDSEKAFDKCLSQVSQIFDLLSNQGLKTTQGFQQLAQNGTLYIQLLQLKTNVFWQRFNQTNALTDLEQAWRFSGQCIDAIEKLRNSFVSEADQIFLVESSYHVYEKALELSFAFFQQDSQEKSQWIDTAFELMERSKSINLLEATLHQKATEYAGLPDSLLTVELNLRQQILKTQEVLFDMQLAGQFNTSGYPEKQSHLVDLKNEYQRLVQFAENNFPVFARLRQRKQVPSLDSLEVGMAQQNTSLVEFFHGNEVVFMIASNGDKRGFYRLGNGEFFQKLCSDFMQSIRIFSVKPIEESIDQYSRLGFELYDQTIGKIDFQLPENIRIVPDGAFRGISFAALLTSPISGRPRIYDLPFAVHDFQFSYVYSVAFESELEEKQMRMPKIKVHAFSPNFNSGLAVKYPKEKGLDSLYFNGKEVEAIHKLIPTKHFHNGQATKEKLQQLINSNNFQASILHIATHGVADQEYGQLSFVRFAFDEPDSPEAKLTARELHALNLPYHLVFLSACETATGEIKRGEGIVGLARGFFYSGVKSLITTLWNISDEVSVKLVSDFYRNLKKGLPKDQALRQAQLNFIQHQKEIKQKTNAHPFYWASFIPIGEMDAMQKTSSLYKPMLIIGVFMLILCIGIYFWFRKKEIKKKAN
jgi:CHAT domain-containing protein